MPSPPGARSDGQFCCKGLGKVVIGKLVNHLIALLNCQFLLARSDWPALLPQLEMTPGPLPQRDYF